MVNNAPPSSLRRDLTQVLKKSFFSLYYITLCLMGALPVNLEPPNIKRDSLAVQLEKQQQKKNSVLKKTNTKKEKERKNVNLQTIGFLMEYL